MAIENGRKPGTAAAEPALPPRSERDVAGRILEALAGLRYGSVEIIVHDAEVIQIERKEKFRFSGAR